MIAVEQYDTETLARWANSLNGWEWPDDLPEKPEGFDDLPVVFRWTDPRSWVNTKHDCITPYMQLMIKTIGHKEFLRWHHIHNLNRTNEQFETWWTETRPITE